MLAIVGIIKIATRDVIDVVRYVVAGIVESVSMVILVTTIV